MYSTFIHSDLVTRLSESAGAIWLAAAGVCTAVILAYGWVKVRLAERRWHPIEVDRGDIVDSEAQR